MTARLFVPGSTKRRLSVLADLFINRDELTSRSCCAVPENTDCQTPAWRKSKRLRPLISSRLSDSDIDVYRSEYVASTRNASRSELSQVRSMSDQCP